MKKSVITVILAIIVLIAPLGVVTTVALASPCQYDKTFLAELKDKHERLKSIKGEKIVLIGGSNLAFGINSEKLEEYVGTPVVNYGLYATIGTKAMLDMSRSYINGGDTVVICPETNKQTYSLYFNAHSMWQAIDCDKTMLYDVGISDFLKLLAGLPEFSAEKLGFIRKHKKPSPTGIYVKSSFNEYGDIKVDRDFNIMPEDYDTSMPVSISTDLLDRDFMDYLNNYALYCKNRGATVYFGFSPINRNSIVSTDKEKQQFIKELKKELDFPILGNIDDYILDSAYFYDTNFHLNSIGALQRTSLLADDLSVVLKNGQIKTEKYAPPERPDGFFETDTNSKTDENEKYFLYEKTKNGVCIAGLSEEGKLQTTVTLPKTAGGKKVVLIGDNAFSGSSCLERVIIKKDSNIRGFTQKSLSDCPTLKAIEIHLPPSDLPIDAEAVTEMPEDCFVYIPEDKYADFATDYFWSSMMKYVKIIGE